MLDWVSVVVMSVEWFVMVMAKSWFEFESQGKFKSGQTSKFKVQRRGSPLKVLIGVLIRPPKFLSSNFPWPSTCRNPSPCNKKRSSPTFLPFFRTKACIPLLTLAFDQRNGILEVTVTGEQRFSGEEKEGQD